MITEIIAFALRNWRWVGGAIGALVIVGAIWGHVHHDAKVKAERDAALAEARQARADAGLWAGAYRSEKAAVGLQNARITALGSTAAEWERRAQAATAEAHGANLAAQASATAFLAIKPKGATVCERAEDVSARIDEDLR